MTFSYSLNTLYGRSKRTGALTLAVLGVLATAGSLQSTAAQTAPPVQACHVNVYAKDPDPKGLNVRRGPGSEQAVAAVITDSDARFEVTGASGKWLRIRQAAGPDGTVYFKGEGWVFASLTGVRAIKAQSLATGKIAADEEATVQGCEGERVQIQVKKNTGWLAAGNYCANPVTGCV